MSGVYIKGMEMPRDCPMCIAAHYNKLDEFTGCEIVSGKKYAVQRDAEYANSSTRPDWCPLIPVPPHGRLIDADALHEELYALEYVRENEWLDGVREARGVDAARVALLDAPTIIPVEE